MIDWIKQKRDPRIPRHSRANLLHTVILDLWEINQSISPTSCFPQPDAIVRSTGDKVETIGGESDAVDCTVVCCDHP